MYKKSIIVILSFFTSFLLANDALDALNLAKEYEKNADFKNAMKYYKKAALLSIEQKEEGFIKSGQNGSIVNYGKNDISGYDDNETDATIKQIIFSTFDVKAYRANYLLPVTYDFQNHEGRKNTETKFQISFKKELTNNLLGLNEKLFLAYTQTSWWQTTAASAPFRETNYEPEVFIQFPYPYEKTALKEYKIGLVHQSNGQDELDSRSWNRLYLSGLFQYEGIFFTPRIWYRLSEDKKEDITQANGDDNPDIHNYLGYGDLRIAYPYKKSLFSILIRNNLKFEKENHGAVQLDWTFPLFGTKDAYGYLQIFSGYGESLIDYNKRSDRIGLGFALTR